MANPSPLRYPGGKYKIHRYIKALIEQNKSSTYIEPFAGGAGVAIALLLNNDVNKVVINDYDRSIYSFWYSVINHTDELVDKISSCNISIDEWYKQKEIQTGKETMDLLSLGFSTLYLNRTNRSGIIKGGVMGGKNQNGMYKLDCRFNKGDLINKIKLIASKKDHIRVTNMDAVEFIEKVIKKTRNSFTFFDPPYFKQGPALYTNFYTDDDHLLLSNKIQNELINRKWIVTYDHEIEVKKMYDKLPYIEYYLSYSAQNKTKGIEYMFFSKKLNQLNPKDYLQLI
ncbi:DNA adenine methylase [Caldibacillus lycopersici]|uniref:site-specific DNA-methyltransferase (adenine-specific) n=1 Tax=Perspicuibacillus lycopersici TaxID=1325689 RepID=A0AAE3ITE5_9BACI|nr:DNA adenine methylase [Perspicuibacillus lycopersici]MCU9614131.1 DNA adenine methylase [Perspicuibacillus lycopersici]